jgi:hypothetical protein
MLVILWSRRVSLWSRRAAAQALKQASVTSAPSVPGSYYMAAAAMSLELHERGSHAV